MSCKWVRVSEFAVCTHVAELVACTDLAGECELRDGPYTYTYTYACVRQARHTICKGRSDFCHHSYLPRYGHSRAQLLKYSHMIYLCADVASYT